MLGVFWPEPCKNGHLSHIRRIFGNFRHDFPGKELPCRQGTDSIMDILAALQDNVLQNIKMLTWQDCVDVLLITFIIYAIVIRLRSSGAARVTKAVILIGVLSLITDLLELNVMSWLLDKVWDIGILALVIVFQPEIRRFLEHMGSGKFRSFFSSVDNSDEMTVCIRNVAAACQDMSKTKTGALIVFEKDNRLDEYFKTGTIIDAETSAELIKNIFFHNAALHDGAVIIREGRIMAAGCVLPLTTSTRIDPSLGTRHRAGLGMSEKSDAVVVIVSEETGTISVAQGGMLKRHFAPETLEKLLERQLIPQEDDNQKKLSLGNLFKVKNHDKKD